MNQATFESLLRYLKDCYSVFDLTNGGFQEDRERIQVAVTFDDGWEDNASTAFPIASRLKVPLTIFVCPELMDTPIPFWPERIVALIRSAGESAEGTENVYRALAASGHPEWATALANGDGDRSDLLIERLKSVSGEERRRLLHSLLSCGVFSKDYGNVDRTMSWSQLAELRRAGVNFGSHTQRHEILTRISLDRAEQEVCESKAVLQEHVGECLLFSYPNGDVSPEVHDMVACFGYKLAFINSPGIWRRTGDPLLIPRINVSEGTLTGVDGRFSPLAFDYRVFWNAFIHRGDKPAQAWIAGMRESDAQCSSVLPDARS